MMRGANSTAKTYSGSNSIRKNGGDANANKTLTVPGCCDQTHPNNAKSPGRRIVAANSSSVKQGGESSAVGVAQQPNHGSSSKRRNNSTISGCQSAWIHVALFLFAVCVAMSYSFFTWHVLFQVKNHQHAQDATLTTALRQRQGGFSSSNKNNNNNDAVDSCSFRTYAPHRYYKLLQSIDEVPDFLKNHDVNYIYGQWPTLLSTSTSTSSSKAAAVQKLCVNQSEWRNNNNGDDTTTRSTTYDQTTQWQFWSFADGTNPSILSMERYQRHVAPEHQLNIPPQQAIHGRQSDQTIAWISTICMTNSQCQWKESPEQARTLHLNPNQTEPDTVRTLVLLLNDRFETIVQATIYLKLDTPNYGSPHNNGKKQSRRKPPPPRAPLSSSSSSDSTLRMPALDDARLFVYQDRLWVSYREGRLFGYDAQVLNPLHLTISSNNNNNNNTDNNNNPFSLEATILASETTSFCCGRNMALFTPHHDDGDDDDEEEEHRGGAQKEPSPLLSVTWVDPITVITVDTTPHEQLRQEQQPRRRLLQLEENDVEIEPTNLASSIARPSDDLLFLPFRSFQNPEALLYPPRRSLLEIGVKQSAKSLKKKKSHVHGTNAFMVYLPQRQEYLGVAHFHRPSDREANPYARFGHHYTHAFYTIAAAQQPGANDNSDTSSYRLMALSPEFVLPQATIPQQETGPQQPYLDAEIIQFISGLEYDSTTQEIILAYGINDCEGAVTRIDYETVVKPMLRSVPPPLAKLSSSSSMNTIEVVDLMEPLKYHQS